MAANNSRDVTMDTISITHSRQNELLAGVWPDVVPISVYAESVFACPAEAFGVWDTVAVCWLMALVLLVTSDSKLSSSCDSPSGKGGCLTGLSNVVGTEDDGIIAAILVRPAI